MKKTPRTDYLTWGCADELASRLQKTLYCGDENGCYDASSTSSLTEEAVSMYTSSVLSRKRPLTQRYASSITRHLQLSPCSILMGILYSERLRCSHSPYLEHVSSADLYVVSLLVATKMLTDEGEEDEIYNDEWAEASGLATSTINKLERDFLEALDWKAYVHPAEFLQHCQAIESRIALKQALARGWFSYTDLSQLFIVQQYQLVMRAIIDQVFKAMSSCFIVYGVSISMMAASVTSMTSAANQMTTSSTGPSSSVNQSTFARHPHLDGKVFEDQLLDSMDESAKLADAMAQNATMMALKYGFGSKSLPQPMHVDSKLFLTPMDPKRLCFESSLGGFSQKTTLTTAKPRQHRTSEPHSSKPSITCQRNYEDSACFGLNRFEEYHIAGSQFLNVPREFFSPTPRLFGMVVS